MKAITRAALAAEATGEIFRELLTISGGGLPSPVYAVRGRDDFVSRGITFQASDIIPVWPSTGTDNQNAAAQLVFEGVSSQFIEKVHQLTGKPSIKLEVVMTSDPDTVIDQTPELDLTNLSVTNLRITGTLSPRDSGDEPTSAIVFGPHTAPAAFISA